MRVDWHPEELTAAVEKHMMDRLEVAAEQIASRARQLVPVGKDVPQGKGKWSKRESGALKRTIRVVRLKGDPKQNVRVYAGNSKDVFYAGWVEYGSVHNDRPRKPFLRPALNEIQGRIESIIGGE